jgi:hypothetical protein
LLALRPVIANVLRTGNGEVMFGVLALFLALASESPDSSRIPREYGRGVVL